MRTGWYYNERGHEKEVIDRSGNFCVLVLYLTTYVDVSGAGSALWLCPVLPAEILVCLWRCCWSCLLSVICTSSSDNNLRDCAPPSSSRPRLVPMLSNSAEQLATLDAVMTACAENTANTLTVEEDNGSRMRACLAEHPFEVTLALSLVLAQHIAGPHRVEGCARLRGRSLSQHRLARSYERNDEYEWI